MGKKKSAARKAKTLAVRQPVQVARVFEAAKQSRRTEGWVTTNAGANAEIKLSLPLLIRRHQDLVDSNPWCKRAVEVLVSNWIGDGIMGAPGPGGTKAFGKMWTAWAESTDCDFYGNLNFYGLQELWTRTTAVRGSALIRFRYEPKMLAKGLVPLQLQVLEPDWLDNSRDDGTGRTIGGKQYDLEGRLEGYWLYQSHPGENHSFLGNNSVYVEKSEVLHTYEHRRPNQYTGIPMGVTALIKARDLDDYQSTELLKQKLSACLVGYRTKADPGLAGVQGESPRIESMEPGAIEDLAFGETITFSDPPKVEGYREVVKTEQHAIAVAYGITFESLTGILSDVNFSSGRMGWIEFARNVERWRWNITVPQTLDPIGRRFIELAAITGQARGPQKMVWTPPRRELINPKEEIGWMKDAIRAGFMTLSFVQKSFGFVPSELLDEYKQDLAELDARGIKVESDMRTDAKMMQPQPAPPKKSPPDESEPEGDPPPPDTPAP